MRYTRAPRSVALTLAVVAIAGLLAACGSSSNTSSSSAAAASSGSGSASSSGSSATRTAARTKLAACLKQHGVTLPTRPAGAGTGGGYGGPPAGGAPGAGGGGGYGSGGGGHFFGGGGAFRSNPKFQAAFKACGGRTFARPGGFHLSHAAIGKFVSCVKQHGYNLPAPNFSGKGPVFPASIERNAKFQAASRACRSALMPPGGSPAGGTTSTG